MDIKDSAFLMNRASFFNIKIGEIVVAKAPAVLKTTLGSCVAVILYDKVNKIGSMVHVMFPDSKGEKTTTPGKFADLGIPLLLKKTLDAGGVKSHIETYVVGGNYLTESKSPGRITFDVGKTNLKAVRKALNKANLRFKEQDIQQNTGTIAIFDVGEGKLKVKFLEKFKKTNISFQKTNILSYDDFVGIVKEKIIDSFRFISSKHKAILVSTEGSYDSAVTINLFGQLKGKLLFYANKKFIYSLFTYGIISKDPPPNTNYTNVLKMAADSFLKPIIKELDQFFKNKNLRIKFTDPSVFTLSKYITLNFNYPESWTVVFRVSDSLVKITLALGKMKEN